MHQIISASDYLVHVVASSQTNLYIRRAAKDYPRYDNPYCQAEFFTDTLKIRCDGSEWESA